MNFSPFDAQAYLAAIVMSSDDAIISKDLCGNITSWNGAAERIFGYTSDEAVGKHISIIIPPDRLDEEDYILGQIRQGNRIDHFETIRRRKNGEMLNLSVTISPIKNSQGAVIGASKVGRDITALKKAERTSAYLSAIIESSNDAIISTDLNGFITSWNKSAERIFGYISSEVVGRHITLIIPVERLDEEDKILATLREGNRIEHFETLRRHKNGTMIPVSLTVSPIRDAAGNVIGASKVSRDISDRIKSEQALKEMSRKKDEFLANMSHELRTPMNAVIGLANILKNMDTLPENAKKFVDTLKISADNMMDLVNDLLDFAKIDAGTAAVENVEFCLTEQVEKVISVLNVKASEKNLALYVNYAPSLSQDYSGDPLRVRQILTNLLSNAVKFTEQGSVELDISAEPGAEIESTNVIFKVSDTGIGIPEDKLSSIFEKFVQADSSITRRYGGSGLGLAITKAFIEKMKGTIEVESVHGAGTTFTVTIPFKNVRHVSRVENLSARAAPAIPVTHKHVLLVEDYEPNIMVARTMLEQMGYGYDVALNGFEALRKFVHGTYDVILMDVQMHELDGLEATRRIRRIEAEKGLQPTPIIAMTAHVREQDKHKCLEAGMDNFISKPFEPAELSEKVACYVRKNEAASMHLPEQANNSLH
ncbi:MAG: PAS domain S-box protein [Rickettsiales bacterium]